MERHGPLTDEDFRVLVEMENHPKAGFLMAWQDGRLFIRAAQGHSDGVGDVVDTSQALERITPGHPRWASVGLHGTK
eukprot:1451485-Alexandrium_andersonii.AAC.1